MSKKKPVAININLAPRDEFYDSFIGKTLKWALSAGRYIIIFTELVVIMSFATRFTLDRQVTDLNGSIEQKKNVILSYGDLESNFREIQAKIDNYQEIDQQKNIVDTFPTLTEVIPRNIKIDELTISSGGVTITGTALSQKSLNQLINNLQLSPEYTNIVVGNIESQDKKSQGFSFDLRAITQEVAVVSKKDAASSEKATIKDEK